MTLKENLALSKRSFLYLYKLEKTYTTMLIVTSVLTALIPYVPIYMSALIIDELTRGQDTKRLTIYVCITVVLTFLLHTFNSWFNKIKEYRQNMLYRNESMEFSKKTMSMDYEQIESTATTSLRRRIQIESQTGYNLFYLRTSVSSIISNIVVIAASVALTVSLFTNSKISSVVKFALILLVALITTINYFTTTQSQKIHLKLFGDVVEINAFGNYISDHFGNYKSGMEVRMYEMEHLTSSLFYNYLDNTGSLVYKSRLITLKYVFCNDFMLMLLQFSAYAFVLFGALSGEVSVGSIVKYVSCVVLLATGFQDLIKNIQTFAENNKYLKTYFSFFDIPSKMYQGTLPIEKRNDNEYEIEFHNVSFKYPSSSMYALRNVSIRLKIGERLAVVGMNGSGKTTFIKLLCRLYEPTEGKITLNSIDIRKYDYAEYMSLFSVVFQDFELFSFSLGQNVAATADYNRAKVEACLKEAGFSERYDGMENRDKTTLYKDFDDKGVEVSGGEAQKIALARALYKNAPFIVLDEPTAALDPIAEYEVYSKFNEIVGTKTAIYISHRLSSCRFCDDIAVFHEGRVIQRGSHDTLVADTNGKYHELWYAQALYYSS